MADLKRNFIFARSVEQTMVSNLVVIAKHGDQYIDGCLESLGDKYPIQVIDTSGGGHPTGAYLKAFKDYPAKHYFFMQDSMIAKQPDYLEPFIERYIDGALAWGLFGYYYDNSLQRAWAESIYSGPHPSHGIFGPVFYTSRKALLKLKRKGLLPPTPTNKNEAQGTERLWAWAYHNAGLPVGGLRIWDRQMMIDGTYPIFQKTFGGRA